MNELCFMSNLTSTEWASWIQAIGSILAIFGAAAIAIWQARRQQATTLRALSEQNRLGQLGVAKALYALSGASIRVSEYYRARLNSRQAIYDVATGANPDCDHTELESLEGSLRAIPLHSLPDACILPTLSLMSNIRIAKENVQGVIRNHAALDADAYKKFFDFLPQLTEQLQDLSTKIEDEVERLARA